MMKNTVMLMALLLAISACGPQEVRIDGDAGPEGPASDVDASHEAYFEALLRQEYIEYHSGLISEFCRCSVEEEMAESHEECVADRGEEYDRNIEASRERKTCFLNIIEEIDNDSADLDGVAQCIHSRMDDVDTCIDDSLPLSCEDNSLTFAICALQGEEDAHNCHVDNGAESFKEEFWERRSDCL